MFKLAERRGQGDGPHRGPDGLYLGSSPLIARVGGSYRVRADDEVVALIAAAYGPAADAGRLLPGLRVAAEALQRGDMARAMIAAVQLRLDEIPEDRLERIARAEALLKHNFNPDEPRVPAGNPDGGQWTTEGSGDDEDGSGGDGGGGGGDVSGEEGASEGASGGESNSAGVEADSGSGSDTDSSAEGEGRTGPPAASEERVWERFPNAAFRNRLAIAERSANRADFGYGEVNPRSGALGRYQMTELGLQAAGMMDAQGRWTGKYGIHSRAQFLASPTAQEMALTDLLDDTERQLRASGAFRYIGTEINGRVDRFTVTRPGLIAAAHREGAEATRDYLLTLARNGFTSRGVDLMPRELRIETRLRTFSRARYE